MPYLMFVLPHRLYWSGLLIFPIVAMLLVRRTEREGARRRVSLSIAYLLWLTSGFVGLHRLYVHNFWGLLYIPLFVLILYGNGQGREARNGLSDARNTFVKSEFLAECAEGDVARGVEGAAAKLAELEATAAAAEIQFGLAEGQLKG